MCIKYDPLNMTIWRIKVITEYFHTDFPKRNDEPMSKGEDWAEQSQAQSIVRQVCVWIYSSRNKCEESTLEVVHGQDHLKETYTSPPRSGVKYNCTEQSVLWKQLRQNDVKNCDASLCNTERRNILRSMNRNKDQLKTTQYKPEFETKIS